jgi:hypothetical protein
MRAGKTNDPWDTTQIMIHPPDKSRQNSNNAIDNREKYCEIPGTW